MDADMEGELGIDSIKQAEIMADLRARFGLPVDEEFQLRDYPSLGHVVSYIGSFTETVETETTTIEDIEPPTEIEESPIVSTPLIARSPSDVQSKRYQVEVEPCEWSSSKPLNLEGRSIVVTDDAWGIAGTLCDALEERGVEAIRVFLDPLSLIHI